MKACVIDASVAVKWYVPEQHSEEALEVLAARERGEVQFHVPDLFTSEVGNVLWQKVRRRVLEIGEAQLIARDLLGTPMTVHSTRDVFGEALRLAAAGGIAFYDSVYVALAVGLGGKLVTADEKLVRAAERAGWGDVVRGLK